MKQCMRIGAGGDVRLASQYVAGLNVVTSLQVSLKLVVLLQLLLQRGSWVHLMTGLQLHALRA